MKGITTKLINIILLSIANAPDHNKPDICNLVRLILLIIPEIRFEQSRI